MFSEIFIFWLDGDIATGKGGDSLSADRRTSPQPYRDLHFRYLCLLVCWILRVVQ